VTWRRILIWLNQHPNQAFTVEDALARDVRRSLESSGGFKAHVAWRAVVAFLVMLIFGLAIFGWHPNIIIPDELASYIPDIVISGWLYVSTLVTFLPSGWLDVLNQAILIISVCYLAVMAYVGIVFVQMKRQSRELVKEDVLNEEHQTYQNRSGNYVTDDLSSERLKREAS